jgi:hypothetical protein
MLLLIINVIFISTGISKYHLSVQIIYNHLITTELKEFSHKDFQHSVTEIVPRGVQLMKIISHPCTMKTIPIQYGEKKIF